ncbi:MAG: LuxR C-terminal-related transcriptional regulator [Terriglobia bacterium]
MLEDAGARARNETGRGCFASNLSPMEHGTPIRILIAGNFPIFRAALRKLLETEPDFNVVGEVPIGKEAALQAKEAKPDIVLLNLAIPNQSDLESVRDLASISPPVRTVILSASIEKAEIIQALQHGVQGMVPRDAVPQQLFEGLRSVMKGQLWIGHESVSQLVDVMRRLLPGQEGKKPRQHFGLTRRELEIVTVIVSGFSNKDIAEKFHLSQHTVKHHVTNIFDKLGVSNRMEVALMAIAHHLVGDL